MPTRARSLKPLLPWVGLFMLASAFAGILILPLRTGQVGYDSAASVLYFDRLAAGRHLESFVTATPKPFLTLVYGAVHAVIPDWRAISWLTIGAFGLGVTLATLLVRRIGGSLAAGFAAVGFSSCALLILDVSFSYAVVWALIWWAGAGIALTSRPPRFGLAGLGLLVAGTARFESLLLSGVAVAAVGAWWLLARAGRMPAMPARAWLLTVGLLALPIQLFHDWLLTGDPWFSQVVPIRGSAGAPLLGAIGRAAWIASRYLDTRGLLLLAVLGMVILAYRRRWPVLLGLAVLGPGIAAFLIYLEGRHIYVSTRYVEPIDLAVLAAASLGFAVIAARALAGTAIERRPDRTALHVVIGGVVALFVAVSVHDLSGITATARSNLILHRNTDAAEPAIRAALRSSPLDRSLPADVPGQSYRDPSAPILFVPPLLRPQMAVDLGLPLTAIAGLSAGQVMGASGLRAGQIVFHDKRGDGPGLEFRVLEGTAPALLGSVWIVPIASDPKLGWWVVRIDPAT